jgi:hypothetical protein
LGFIRLTESKKEEINRLRRIGHGMKRFEMERIKFQTMSVRVKKVAP